MGCWLGVFIKILQHIQEFITNLTCTPFTKHILITIFFSSYYLGQYHKLYEVLDREFENDFSKYVGLDRELFNEVLNRVAPRLEKSSA
jgi:hypothetical protein